MKRSILLFFLLAPVLLNAQTEIRLSGTYPGFIFFSSTQHEIENKLGKPDTLKSGFINANTGMGCISFRHAYLTYSSKGVFIKCSSYGTKKTSKKKKKLWSITFDERSGFILNEKIECGKSTKDDVTEQFPEAEKEETANQLSCVGKLGEKKFITLIFVFDENNILKSIKMV